MILDALAHLRATAEAMVAAGTLAEFEILVVDDGSSDATGALVASAAATDPRVRLLTHPRNRGVGGALQTGIAAASGTHLLYTDADLPVDIGEVAAVLGLLTGEVGLVAGRRTTYATASRLRAWGAHGYDRLVRAVLGLAVHDVNFPFKLLPTDLARSLPLVCEGALVDAELIARVVQGGWGVEQRPMVLHERTAGSSKTFRPRLLAQLSLELIRHRRQLRARPAGAISSG